MLSDCGKQLIFIISVNGDRNVCFFGTEMSVFGTELSGTQVSGTEMSGHGYIELLTVGMGSDRTNMGFVWNKSTKFVPQT